MTGHSFPGTKHETLKREETICSKGVFRIQFVIMNTMNTDIFSRLENGALRTLLNVSAISLCVFTLSGLVFFRLEAWAQRQEINVQLAAIALDGDTMVAQVRRALIESHRGLGSH